MQLWFDIFEKGLYARIGAPLLFLLFLVFVVSKLAACAHPASHLNQDVVFYWHAQAFLLDVLPLNVCVVGGASAAELVRLMCALLLEEPPREQL